MHKVASLQASSLTPTEERAACAAAVLGEDGMIRPAATDCRAHPADPSTWHDEQIRPKVQ